jgi:hypothetical protein
MAFQVSDDAPVGLAEVKLSMTYQACHKSGCMAPTTMVVVIPRTIQKGKKRHQVSGWQRW